MPRAISGPKVHCQWHRGWPVASGSTCTAGWSVRYLQTAWESFEFDVDAVTTSSVATLFYKPTSLGFPRKALASGSS